MKIIVQILIKITLVTAMADFRPPINNERSFTSALSTVIAEFYVTKSNTIFISHCSINRPDVRHDMILGKILAVFAAKTSVSWTINDHHYLSNSIERISNIIIIDSYKSWRYSEIIA